MTRVGQRGGNSGCTALDWCHARTQMHRPCPHGIHDGVALLHRTKDDHCASLPRVFETLLEGRQKVRRRLSATNRKPFILSLWQASAAGWEKGDVLSNYRCMMMFTVTILLIHVRGNRRKRLYSYHQDMYQPSATLWAELMTS